MGLRIADLPDALLADGQPWFTTEEAAARTQRGLGAVHLGLSRLRRAGRVFSPAEGFYVVVPPDFQSWGVVPGEWFIEGMMQHLHRDYYVGLLSAAEMHGAAHQAPQAFQVMVDRQLRDRDCGRVHLRFVTSRLVGHVPTVRRAVHTGYVTVAAPETLAVDLSAFPERTGYWSNVATVLRELGPLDGAAVARIAAQQPVPVAQRLGWLAETFHAQGDLAPLAELVRGARTVLLEPGSRTPILTTDRTWHLRVNAVVEPDA
jgi:predicted transcriptional regulator of viral defense system